MGAQSLSHARLFVTVDCSPPGSSVHGILRARALGWRALSSSSGPSCISCIGRWTLQHQCYLVAHTVEDLSAKCDTTWVRPLGWEDPLEKEMASHSSILAWRIHGQRSLAGYGPWGCRVGGHWAINTQCPLGSPHKLVYLPVATTLGIYFSYFLCLKNYTKNNIFSNISPKGK